MVGGGRRGKREEEEEEEEEERTLKMSRVKKRKGDEERDPKTSPSLSSLLALFLVVPSLSLVPLRLGHNNGGDGDDQHQNESPETNFPANFTSHRLPLA